MTGTIPMKMSVTGTQQVRSPTKPEMDFSYNVQKFDILVRKYRSSLDKMYR